MDEDMPGMYDFIAAAPSNALAGSAPDAWIPVPPYADEDFVASPVPSPPAAGNAESELDLDFDEELANMPLPNYLQDCLPFLAARAFAPPMRTPQLGRKLPLTDCF